MPRARFGGRIHPRELLPRGRVCLVRMNDLKTRARLLPVMMLVGLAPVAQGEMAPESWLARASQASERVNFTGTLSLPDARATRRMMRIKQGFDGRDTHQRWVSLSGGEDCEIVRRSNESAVVFPGRRVVIHGYQRPEGLVPRVRMDLARMRQYYELEVKGRERIAGRDCQWVAVVPKDRYRYGCELCVDAASGLPLRVRMVTPDGEKIEQFQFTSLDVLESIQQFSPGSFWLATDIHGFKTISLPYGFRRMPNQWRIENMPPGFERRLAVARRLPRTPEPVYHMVLADAMSRISIFITRLPEEGEVRSQRFTRKALNGYVTVRDGHQVTVIGGVPAETVRMIGDSIHRKR